MKRLSSPILWTGSLAALLSMASCMTIAELAVVGLAEAVTGERVEASGPTFDAAGRQLQAQRDQREARTANVYQEGPLPGWERGFRARASVGSSYYQNGLCLNIPLNFDLSRLWTRGTPDPFGPIDRPAYELLVQVNTQGIPTEYTRFGEVRLGGPSSTGEVWQPLGMPGMVGMNGVSCPVFGVFTTGRHGGEGVILR